MKLNLIKFIDNLQKYLEANNSKYYKDESGEWVRPYIFVDSTYQYNPTTPDSGKTVMITYRSNDGSTTCKIKFCSDKYVLTFIRKDSISVFETQSDNDLELFSVFQWKMVTEPNEWTFSKTYPGCS